MTRTRFAAVAAASLLALSAPAWAQMSGPMSAPAASKPMGTATNGTAGGMNESNAMPTTCQGMMDKASPMAMNMTDGSKKTMAMKQMDMAKTSMAAGKEKSCMTHMKSAMKDMM